MVARLLTPGCVDGLAACGEVRRDGGLVAAAILSVVAFAWIVFATGRVTLHVDTLKAVPAFALLSVAAALLAVRAARKVDPPATHRSLVLPAYGLHLLITLLPSIFWSRGYDTAYLVCTNLFMFVAAWLVSVLVRQRGSLSPLSTLWVLALFAVSVGGVFEWLGLAFVDLNPSGDRIGSFFFHPTVYSGFLALSLPVALCLLLASRTTVSRLSLGLVVALAGFNLYATQSRGSFLAAIGGFVLLGAVSALSGLVGSSRRATVATILACGLLLLLPSVLQSGVYRRLLDAISLPDVRRVPFGMAVRMWTQTPRTVLFGNGLGSFRPLSYLFKPPDYRGVVPDVGWDAVHNEYLELLVDGGVLSLAAFLLVCATAVIGVRRCIRSSDDRVARLLCVGHAVSAASFLIDIFFSTNSRVSFVMLFLAIDLGAIDAAARSAGRPRGVVGPLSGEVSRRNSSRDACRPVTFTGSPAALALRILLVAGATVALILADLVLVRRFASEASIASATRVRQTGSIALVERDAEKQIQALQYATRADDGSVHAWYLLAQAMLNRGDVPGFLAACDRVEQLMPGYEDVEYLRAVASAMEGRYEDAAAFLRGYLELNGFDRTAETYSVCVDSLRSRWDLAVDGFRTVVEHDLAPSLRRPDFRLEFPDSENVVRLVRDSGGTVVRLGVPSINAIVRGIVDQETPVFNLYLFRMSFVLGNVYRSFGLESQAIAHMEQAYRLYATSQEAVGRARSFLGAAIPAVDHGKALALVESYVALLSASVARTAGTIECLAYLSKLLDVAPSDALLRSYVELARSNRMLKLATRAERRWSSAVAAER